ncbi:MAG: glycoside hydrolase family 3 C-terminal domain-containing protein [Clostridiales bacterium]|jgi:beta-glucosidase|nr:glycoside hydrolase family 3 C-terminal domain-containing protein [Clostridiales bacterium]
MRDIKELISQMTLEEKAGMCSGSDFWHLKGVERLGIPQIMVSDGPHGLRKQDLSKQGDHLGINDSIKAVCFPAACATAASFDTELLYTLGCAIGDECQAEDVSIILGPAINIKRSPLCGRNFEYFSEDPYLAGELAASQIKGAQSKNIGTSLKHFAANNQEHHRMSASSEIDPRTLREIYLRAFEICVAKAQPWTVMCSYNKVNGVYASEHQELLTDILRGEWGFDGFVVSDWGAVNDRVLGLKAGLDLEMPWGGGTDSLIVKAVQDGSLDEAVLDQAVSRILEKVFRYSENRLDGARYDKDEHHELAVRFERECAVLLKNEGVLPLTKGDKIAFIGEYAKKPRFQGGGSSHINSFKTISALLAAENIGGVTYAPGFCADKDETNDEWLAEAASAAGNAKIAVVFAGLPDIFESEGYDRSHMRLPDSQNKVIEAVANANENTVVVLHNGSPVEMPWADKVKGILELYLGGQGVGEAAVSLLFGDSNPCGKLPETFPLKLSDNPSYLNFPGASNKVFYSEGVFTGYRYYDKKQMDVLFPFGHGLSYTSFEYSNLRLDKDALPDDGALTVSVDVSNTGERAGKEIVQLYVSDLTCAAVRPEKELKGFIKLSLEKGETKTATFVLDKRSFAFYDADEKDWRAATGKYEILVGASSRNLPLKTAVNLFEASPKQLRITQNTLMEEILANPKLAEAVQEFFKTPSVLQGSSEEASEAITSEMMIRTMMEAPLRTLRTFYGFSPEKMDETVSYLNSLL